MPPATKHLLATAVVSCVIFFDGVSQAAELASLEQGKTVFQNNCVAAAAAIPGPKPRNFVEGNYKYGSKTADVLQTVTNGVAGTAMPPWSALSQSDREAVVRYILSLKK